ncbi:unnamed protein product [Schistosoma margrebowiei]|uniref:Uncharacterized protein n=2 Tax=Schistosoma TaxID=6181 RepID=A0A183LT03_9TREM|nr:unnamed protein product [Schistosoma margrebowiei]
MRDVKKNNNEEIGVRECSNNHSHNEGTERSMLGDSRSLVLRVHLPKAGITKTTAFDAQMTVGQACERIRAQVRESDQTDGGK